MLDIDACGLSCPEPVIMLKKGLKESDEIRLLVDNKTSVETCGRYARSLGLNVEVKTEAKPYELLIKRVEKQI